MVDLTGYKLTFDDEFDASSISQTGVGTTWSDIRPQWRYDAESDIGFGHSSFLDAGSGYNPFSVSGGALTITAEPNPTSYGYPGSWASGLISTQNSFSQTYGYFEMRAQLSSAPGSWDAFWMLADQPAANSTNASGWQELDVVEHYGDNPDGIYSAIHTTDDTPASDLQAYSVTPDLTSGYHTYGMMWGPDTIDFYVDGKLVGSQATPSDMHGPMYLLADLATKSDASGSSMATKIDYIRAFSNDPSAQAVVQQAVSAPDGQDPGLYGATAAPSLATGATAQVDASQTAATVPVTSAPVPSTAASAAATPAVSTVQMEAPSPIASLETVTTSTPAPVATAQVDASQTAATAPVTSALVPSTVASAAATPAVSAVQIGVPSPIAAPGTVGSAVAGASADAASTISGTPSPAIDAPASLGSTAGSTTSAAPAVVLTTTAATAIPDLTPATAVSISTGAAAPNVHVTIVGNGRQMVDVLAPGQNLSSDANDTFLNHGQGDNTFVFDPGYGVDVVKLFRASGADHDTISLPSSDFSSFADVLRNAHNAMGSVSIDDPVSGDVLRLSGMTKADLVQNRRDVAFHM